MILVIDTTNEYIVLGLLDNDKVISNKSIKTFRNQAEIINEEVKIFFNENKVDFSNIKEVIVSSGPGSFTGIRVGLSFVKAMNVSMDIKVYTTNTLALLQGLSNKKTYLDARSNKVYILKDKEIILEEISNINIDEYETFEMNHQNIVSNALVLYQNNLLEEGIRTTYIKGVV